MPVPKKRFSNFLGDWLLWYCVYILLHSHNIVWVTRISKVVSFVVVLTCIISKSISIILIIHSQRFFQIDTKVLILNFDQILEYIFIKYNLLRCIRTLFSYYFHLGRVFPPFFYYLGFLHMGSCDDYQRNMLR